MSSYILKINQSKVEMFTPRGQRVRSFSCVQTPVSADYNDHLNQSVVTLSSGKVCLYSELGSLVRTVYQGSAKAVDAGWVGDDLHITFANNDSYLYRTSGTRIRRI